MRIYCTGAQTPCLPSPSEQLSQVFTSYLSVSLGLPLQDSLDEVCIFWPLFDVHTRQLMQRLCKVIFFLLPRGLVSFSDTVCVLRASTLCLLI